MWVEAYRVFIDHLTSHFRGPIAKIYAKLTINKTMSCHLKKNMFSLYNALGPGVKVMLLID